MSHKIFYRTEKIWGSFKVSFSDGEKGTENN